MFWSHLLFLYVFFPRVQTFLSNSFPGFLEVFQGFFFLLDIYCLFIHFPFGSFFLMLFIDLTLICESLKITPTLGDEPVLCLLKTDNLEKTESILAHFRMCSLWPFDENGQDQSRMYLQQTNSTSMPCEKCIWPFSLYIY